MTVLMTGATGLVGTRLLRRLLDAGHECRALVRAGKDVPAGASRVEGDILDPDSLPAAVLDVSAVIHLAALFRTTDEAAVWRVNHDGTRNLIAAVEEHAPTARFMMASTSNVYVGGTHPGREDDEVTPTQAYPASKVAAETALRQSTLTWSTLRLPFVYGDGDGHLDELPGHLRRMHAHPARKLSVIHHRDVATAFTLAMTGALDRRVVNVADEAALTNYELAQLAGSAIDSSSEPLADPWKAHMDITLARSLGFQPTVLTAYQAAREGIL